MALQKSKEHTEKVQAQKLFARMREEIQTLENQVNEILATANGMRLTIGATTLAIAEIEHLYIAQSADKRRVDAMVDAMQTQLDNLIATTQPLAQSANEALDARQSKVDNLQTSAARIIGSRHVEDPVAVMSGVYVGVEFFAEQLGLSRPSIRNAIGQGKLPKHDNLSTGGRARPKRLWLRSNAIIAVAKYRSENKVKKGIAALV